MSAFLHSTLLKSAAQDATGKMLSWGITGAAVGGAYGYATDTGTIDGIGKGILAGAGGAAALKYAGNKYATGVINAINDLDNVYDRKIIQGIAGHSQFLDRTKVSAMEDYHKKFGQNFFYSPNTPAGKMSKNDAFTMMNDYYRDVTSIGSSFNMNMFSNKTAGVSLFDRINVSQPIANLDSRLNEINSLMGNRVLRNEFANWQKDTLNTNPYKYNTMLTKDYFGSGSYE